MIQTYLFARLLLFAYYTVKKYAILNAATVSRVLSVSAIQDGAKHKQMHFNHSFIRTPPATQFCLGPP